jgi:hypothetical protein
VSALEDLTRMLVSAMPPHSRGDALSRLERTLQDARDDQRVKTLREAADAISESEELRSWTDDHMGDIHEAATVLRRMAEGEGEQ